MLQVNRDLSITLIQGDKGGIEFSLDCIELKEKDEVWFTISNNNGRYFTIKGVNDKGVSYIEFTKSTSNRLTPGMYNYDISVKVDDMGIDSIMVSSTLESKRGYFNE